MSIYAEDVFIECRSMGEEVIITFYSILSFIYKFQSKDSSQKKGVPREAPLFSLHRYCWIRYQQLLPALQS